MYNINNKKSFLFSLSTKGCFVLTLMLFTSCKKFVNIPLPDNQLTSDFVFSNDNSALGALNGIYSKMIENDQQFCSGYTTLFTGLSSDELYYYTPSFRDEFMNNQISLINHGNIESSFWTPCYRYIYAANKCIEDAQNSNGMSSKMKRTTIGEAKFIRAFCYFYLVNLFGDVPFELSSIYQENQWIARSPLTKVYYQIIDDLKGSIDSLDEIYASDDRGRPNKYAAIALLARVYLYNNDWVDAENEATIIINSGIYTMDNDLNSVFKSGSNETIWQLVPVNPYINTWEGNEIIPYSIDATPTYLLTSTLVNSFEAGDMRKPAWVQSENFSGQTIYYPYKYKINSAPPVTEFYVVLRLAEQYLIRAESRANINDIEGAQNDLNIIRNRAGLNNTIANDKASMLKAIEHERQIELFAEWGHRWFDLKRTDRANTVLGSLKPSTWQATDTLWPIPESQIRLNPALTQNVGY